MILVMIFVLSILIVQFTEKAMAEIAVEGHYADRERLRITAYSALESTLAVLADVVAVDGGLTSPAQGWADPLAIAGFEAPEETTVTVTFSDETGKLPLSKVDEVTLGLLFTRMGYDASDSQHLTETLLDWIDADDETRLDGAESDFYGEREWPHHSSNQPIRRLSELALVDGFKELFFDEAGRPNEAFRIFAATVSLHGGGGLNANSATELALRSAAMFGDAQIDALRDYLAGPDRINGTEDDRYFSSNDEITAALGAPAEGTGAALVAGISVLRVHVEVAFGVNRFALEAVIQPGQGPTGGGGAGTPRPPGNETPGGSSREQRNQREDRRQISYPFVFLELTEDVGHNATIAASIEESAEASNLTSRPNP
jgi:type II secretory pathway component PulK